MTLKDISITELEKLALTINEKKAYGNMNRYYGMANAKGKSMTTEEYKNNLNQIIKEKNKNVENLFN